ncbi:MAG TPA: hypothetical protein VHH88_13995, partial [Verrucomicrobiae bacterium]|nr:hypothetical protein [Verrucomicrobiae bacterium]
SFSGPGAFAANGSSPVIWLDADCTIPILDLESASALDGPGNLTVTQLMTAVSTTVRGSGLMNIAAGATFNATNATYSNLGRDVNNSGEARVSSTLSATRALFWNNLPGSSLALYGPNAGLDMNYSGAPPSLLNSGSVSNATVNSPNLNWGFTNAAMLQCNPFGITFKQPYMQTAGNTLVTAGSVLSFSKNARILGGTVNGTGAIEGNVFNAATLHPGGSPGILTLNGNFTNASAGVFAVDIAGPAPGTGYSRLSSAFGQLSFDGALHVNFVNGFVPSPGDIYTIAASTNGARVGAFSALQGLHAPNGLVLVPVYGPTNVSLVAASEPAMTGVSHAGSTASFEFQSTAGLTNVVEYTTNLNPPSWITLTTIPGDGSLKTVLDPSATNATRFYRVRFR